MHDVLSAYYLQLKALHIIFVISWMCGLLYLPRLFIYHAKAQEAGESTATFKVMEHKLLKIIMNPAMIGSFFFGILLILASGPYLMQSPWIHYKLFLVVVLAAYHMYCARLTREFKGDKITHNTLFLRVFNEFPAILMIIIVFLVVLKP